MSNDAELAELARSCPALHHAHLVANWVGNGRDVTEDAIPFESDVAELANTLGVTVPDGVTSAIDIPEMFRAWVVALDRELIEFDAETHVTTGTGVVRWAGLADEEVLEQWAEALVAAVAAALGIEDDADAVQVCIIALQAARSRAAPADAEEVCAAMENHFREEYESDTDDPDAEAMTLHRSSSRQLLAEFTAFGLVNAACTVTELGERGFDELNTIEEQETDMLGELADMLQSGGIDPTDSDSLANALEELLGGDSAEEEEMQDADDFAALDLKDAFELPGELPPVSLPRESELADIARAHELPGITADSDDGQALAAWSQAFYELLASETFYSAEAEADTDNDLEADFVGLGSITAVLLILGRNSGVPLQELEEVGIQSCAPELEPEQTRQVWQAWVAAYGNPLYTFLDRLGAHGAVHYDEQMAWLTPLGLYAVRERMLESDIDVPVLPPVERMSAADLVALVEYGDEQELANFSSLWLGLRDPADAAAELLAVAADGTPGQRVIATAITGAIDPAPVDAWKSVLDEPSVSAYAKMALGKVEAAPEDPDALRLTELDLGWLLADTLASSLGALTEEELSDELEEVVTPDPEQATLLDGVARCGHPQAVAVLTAISEHHPDTATAGMAREALTNVSP